MAAFTTYNNVALADIFSTEIFGPFVPGIMHVNGKGVDESYAGEKTGAASISIPFVPLGEGGFRRLGASVNGGQFNSKEANNPASSFIELPLTLVYDRTETVSELVQNKANYALLQKMASNVRLKMALAINAATIAEQIAGACNDMYKDSYEATTVVDGGYRNAFVKANGKLDDGDAAYDIYRFPANGRQAIVSPAFRDGLFENGQVILDSSVGQEMLANGILNPWQEGSEDALSTANIREDYIGTIMGVPVMLCPPMLWKSAEEYLNSGSTKLTTGALNGILGYICAAIGTLRGFSSNNNVKVVDAQQGQGYVIQPLLHGGVKCISGKSVRLVVDDTFTNPVTSNATKLSVAAPESR